jgi:hypothetical protein
MWRVPLWSWTSLDGRIVIPAEADIESVIPAVLVAEVMDVGVEPEGLEHGELVYRVLTILGALRMADPRCDPKAKPYRGYDGQSTKEHLCDDGESIG